MSMWERVLSQTSSAVKKESMNNEELTVCWTELKHIKVQSGFNLRGKVKPDPDLVERIKKDGVLHPIHIRTSDDGKHFLIVDGERRYQAAKAAGLQGIHVILHESMADEDAMLFSYRANEAQKPWTPGQKFRMFTRLHDRGWDSKRIGEELLVSKKTVYEYLKTKEKGAPRTKKALAAGAVSSRVSSRLANLPKKKQGKVLDDVEGKGTKEAIARVRREEENAGLVLRGPKPKGYKLADDAVDRCQELERLIREQLDLAPRHKVLRAQLRVIEVLKGKVEASDIFPDFVKELRRVNGW